MGNGRKMGAGAQRNLRFCFRFVQQRRTKKIIAYWHLLPITDKLYERALAGENINALIDVDDIDFFTTKREYSVYFVDLFIKRSKSNIYSVSAINDHINLFFGELVSNGFNIKRVCANLTTSRIKNFGEGLGLNFVCDHQVHRTFWDESKQVWNPSKIYEIKIDKSVKTKLSFRLRQFLTNKLKRKEKLRNLFDEIEGSMRNLIAANSEIVAIPKIVRDGVMTRYAQVTKSHPDKPPTLAENDKNFWAYADFSHLKMVMEDGKNWVFFSTVFKNKELFEQYFKKVLDVRNSLSHGRPTDPDDMEKARVGADWLLKSINRHSHAAS